MSFNPAVPLSSDSPATFPGQNQVNMFRLQTLLGADHQFNAAPAANDGYHKLIRMTQQAPSGPLASTGRSYVKSSAGRIHQFYMDDTGQEYQITPTLPIRASVNFDGRNTTNIRSSYNVSTVIRNSDGDYTVNFINPMPDNNYIVHALGMREQSGKFLIPCVAGSATYTTSMTTGFVRVTFFDSNKSPHDGFMLSVTVISVI